METFVRKTGDMVRVLEIKAEASDLETDVRLALKNQQSMANLRGFRRGRVPLNMVRRLYAKDIEQVVVETLIKEVFEDIVEGSGKYKLLGKIQEIHREYELDGDLKVQIEFFVVPEIEFKNLSGQVLEVPFAEVTDDMVDFFIQKRMRPHLESRPLEQGERIGEGHNGAFDRVKYELVEVDRETGRVLIGKDISPKEKMFDYGSPGRVKPEEYEDYVNAFAGCSKGDEVLIDKDIIVKNDSPIQAESIESDYRVKILEAYRFDFPEIDEEWVGKIIKGVEGVSADALYVLVRGYLLGAFKDVNRDILETHLKDRMLELYPFSIPTSLMDQLLATNTEAFGSAFAEERDSLDELKKDLCWRFLLEEVGTEFGEDLPEEFKDPNLSEEEIERVASSHMDSVIDQLLKKFEIKYLSAPGWYILQLIDG